MGERWVVTGASGLLGGWLARRLSREGAAHDLWAQSARGPYRGVPCTDAGALRASLLATRPTHVIHAAAVSTLSDAAGDRERAFLVNTTATEVVSATCASLGASLVLCSTDLVFDGERAPYDEESSPAPGTVYGRTKRDAELAALAHGAVVARLSLLFGPTRTARRGFFDAQVDALRERRPITLFDDEHRTPAALEDAADALVTLARARASGVVHIGGSERMSRFAMGERLAAALGVTTPALVRASRTSIDGEARPRDVSLTTLREAELGLGRPARSFEAWCARMMEAR